MEGRRTCGSPPLLFLSQCLFFILCIGRFVRKSTTLSSTSFPEMVRRIQHVLKVEDCINVSNNVIL